MLPKVASCRCSLLDARARPNSGAPIIRRLAGWLFEGLGKVPLVAVKNRSLSRPLAGAMADGRGLRDPEGQTQFRLKGESLLPKNPRSHYSPVSAVMYPTVLDGPNVRRDAE